MSLWGPIVVMVLLAGWVRGLLSSVLVALAVIVAMALMLKLGVVT